MEIWDILTRFYDNRIDYFKNIGTAASPDFKKVPDTENPFDELFRELFFTTTSMVFGRQQISIMTEISIFFRGWENTQEYRLK